MTSTSRRDADRICQRHQRPRVVGRPDAWSQSEINSALMNDLDIVAVRIEHPSRIIARIVFVPRLR
jgi:hypothetical protein